MSPIIPSLTAVQQLPLREAVGLIYGSRLEDIAHLAPLIEILAIPLYVTDPEIYEKIVEFFPSLSVHQFSPNLLGKALFATTNVVISCLSTQKIRTIFRLEETLHKKRFHTVFLPQSYLSPINPELLEEKHLFFFGKTMSDQLASLAKSTPFKQLICLGNYRHLYTTSHPVSLSHFDEVLSFKDTIPYKYPMQKGQLERYFTPYSSLEEIRAAVSARLKEIGALDNTLI